VVHLVTALVFTSIRQVIVNRMVGATAGQAVRSVLPGATVALCVLVVALPVRLMTSAGFLSMVAIAGAGVVGGLLGLALSRAARTEVGDLVSKVRG
jgi:hypothetical protein